MDPRRLHVGLGVMLLLFGFLITVAALEERVRESGAPARQAELRRLIEERRATIDDLSREVSRVAASLEEVRQEAGEGARTEMLLRRVEELRQRAGLAPVQGPGVVVELRDSDREPRTRDEVTDLRIQDVDVQLAVNALWRAGAEAVAVNGRRLVSTTAIRRAGTAILINYRAVSSPYRVAAIGDPAALEQALLSSQLADRFDVWDEVYGLGFTVERAETLRAPALPGQRDLRHADPVREPA